MDLATVLGLFIAWGALLTALLLEGGKPGDLFLLSPAILVFGGTLGATCITASMSGIRKLPVLIRLGLSDQIPDPRQMVRTLVGYSVRARRDGVLGLEQEVKRVQNRFMRRGLELVVDGTPSEMVREILETEIGSMLQRHRAGHELFTTAGGFAPTMGIIGTVMGLIHMLNSLSEPAKMGPAIAAAFMATLYGVMIANLFLIPMGTKLKARSEDEAAIYEMMIDGILAIQAGENPRVVESRMLAFLAPEMRQNAPVHRVEPRGRRRRAA